MKQKLNLVAFLVRDYDEAITWFQDALGFSLSEDVDQGSKRWVVVKATPKAETGFLLARADGSQAEQIGQAAAGRVAYFLTTDDFEDAHQRMLAAGVTFEEAPRHESYGSVAVFRDLYGNRWDLIQPAR